MKILSNDQLLLTLHTALFGKKLSSPKSEAKMGNIRSVSLRSKFGLAS